MTAQALLFDDAQLRELLAGDEHVPGATTFAQRVLPRLQDVRNAYEQRITEMQPPPVQPVEQICVTTIRMDGGTQMRAWLNRATIDEYADILYRQERTLDWPFPPLEVFHDGSDYWLADGFHRLAAFIQVHGIANNRDVTHTVPALVRAGTRRDAMLYAAGANAGHGLRRSPADKWCAVEALLVDAEWGQWADREIARHCHVSPSFVGQVRAKLGIGDRPSYAPAPLPVTVHVDSEKRAYTTKHGTDAVMNTAAIGTNPPRRDPEPRPARALPEPTPARVVYDDQGDPRREPVYVQVWALEQLVRNWAAGKAISNDPHGDLALEQVKTLPATVWAADLLAMIVSKLSDPYRKGDLIQAINNVIEQRRQETQRAELLAEPPAEAPAIVPTVNELIADTEAAYRAMFAEDAPVVEAPAALDDLPLVDSIETPGLTAEERLERRWQFTRVRSRLREAIYALPDYENMTGDFASRGPLLRVLEPMIATVERHLSAYESRKDQAA